MQTNSLAHNFLFFSNRHTRTEQRRLVVGLTAKNVALGRKRQNCLCPTKKQSILILIKLSE
ncbi:hypothetical protein DSUL_90028 [Desulfovibrionales bacterium]